MWNIYKLILDSGMYGEVLFGINYGLIIDVSGCFFSYFFFCLV